MSVIFWEHEHAYQPRRILDGFTSEERVVREGVQKTVRNRRVKSKNWFDVVLIPNSIYDEIVASTVDRSINIEPITLEGLKKLNESAYRKLIKIVETEKTSIVATSYCHPILPMMLDNSELDTRVNFVWSLAHFHREFLSSLQKKNGSLPLGFWFPECAFSMKVARVFFEVLNDLIGSWGWKSFPITYLILDERQSEDVDPSRPYLLRVGDNKCFIFYRYHRLSNVIAFNPDFKTIMKTFLEEAARCRHDLIGAANDAECYGGNYDPNKPVIVEKMRDKIRHTTIECPGVGKKRVKIASAATYLTTLKETATASTEPNDYSSWSDYTMESRFRYPDEPQNFFEYYVGEKPGGLSRWTGLEREPDGTLSNRTYFLIVSSREPRSGHIYARVVSSLWKVAFNEVRNNVANFVRSQVFTILKRYVGDEKRIERSLTQYWTCAIIGENIREFIERMKKIGLIDYLNPEKDIEVFEMTLQAYELACQDALISDPTFWQFFENELTWTSLAHSTASLAKIATAYHVLGEEERLKEVADKYRQLFLQFGSSQHWKQFVQTIDAQLKRLMESLREAAKQGGYDTSMRFSRKEILQKTEQELWTWAQQTSRALYDAALRNLGEVKAGDENPHLVLAELYESNGMKERAEKEWQLAKWFEWEKCIRHVYSDKNIVQRVGLLHAKHFPEFQRFLGLSEEEIIGADTRIG